MVSQTTSTDFTGSYQYSNLVSGYYVITPKLEGHAFEPPNYTMQNLNSSSQDMDFIATEIKPAPPCVVELVYKDYPEGVKTLRYLRDNALKKTLEGREIIRLYYQWSPVIIKAMGEDEEIQGEIKEMIDGMLLLIRKKVALE